jgi:hypothetical protein
VQTFGILEEWFQNEILSALLSHGEKGIAWERFSFLRERCQQPFEIDFFRHEY